MYVLKSCLEVAVPGQVKFEVTRLRDDVPPPRQFCRQKVCLVESFSTSFYAPAEIIPRRKSNTSLCILKRMLVLKQLRPRRHAVTANFFSLPCWAVRKMNSGVVEPNTFVALRLPSDSHAITEVKPNTYVEQP